VQPRPPAVAAGAGQHRSSVPTRNGRYRDAVRDYWRGRHVQPDVLAGCLAGSPRSCSDEPAQPFAGVNFVTAHDGFTLRELVSCRRPAHVGDRSRRRHGGSPYCTAKTEDEGVEGPVEGVPHAGLPGDHRPHHRSAVGVRPPASRDDELGPPQRVVGGEAVADRVPTSGVRRQRAERSGQARRGEATPLAPPRSGADAGPAAGATSRSQMASDSSASALSPRTIARPRAPVPRDEVRTSNGEASGARAAHIPHPFVLETANRCKAGPGFEVRSSVVYAGQRTETRVAEHLRRRSAGTRCPNAVLRLRGDPRDLQG